VAVDEAVCRLVGVRPEDLPTHRAATELGLVNEAVAIAGDALPVPAFKLPVLAPLTFGPKRLQRLAQAPGPTAGRRSRWRRLCGECWRYRPAKAITPYATIVGFDYDRRIRCYCCIEMCPHGALKSVETQPGKVMRHLAGVRDRITVRMGRKVRREGDRRIDFDSGFSMACTAYLYPNTDNVWRESWLASTRLSSSGISARIRKSAICPAEKPSQSSACHI
jgi:ferredoxin